MSAGERAMEPEPHTCARELRAARTFAEQLMDRRRQFTADASHELRTPLAALRVQVEEARLHPDEIDLPELLHHVADDLDRLENIVNDLHLLVTLEDDLGRSLAEVNLTTLAETAAARWAGTHDVRLDLEPAVMVEAASWQITRLLDNLLDNARRHATHRLEVSLRRAGDQAELAVSDDGQGVPQADRERVFQCFARLDTARSRDRGGAGLGLAIARGIASAHRGTLHVEETPDGGARFVFRIPLAR
ncbi:ATP-binding protein [Nonomuraea sp. NPDC049709]|uniref:sensor histidine kinase n=1 Tax=Nonomuraea sp. NPDC049709 TaxID=3154736 RepID=UPI00342E3F77